MKHTLTLIAALIATSAMAAVLWLGFGGRALAQSAQSALRRKGSGMPRTWHLQQHAQPGCKVFLGIAQATVPTSTPLAPTDIWGGPIHATLGGEFLGLKTVLSGNDGEANWYEEETVGVGKGGAYTVCTDHPACKDTFTLEVPMSVFPNPPTDLGIYLGYSVSIVKGTGRFAAASGNLQLRGPFLVWQDNTSPIGLSGRWYPEITGNICGVQ